MSSVDRQADLIAQIGAAVRAYQRSADAIDELASELLGVNRTDGRVLDLLHEHGAMTAGALAARSGLTSGAVTGVVDRLERAGYVRRVRDPADRRRVTVDPTPELYRRAQEIYGPLAPAGEAAMRRYSEEELATCLRFLREAIEISEAHAAELRSRRRG